ncbi:hypothetical protein [Streptomyces sp. NPDC046261]|uniref:hypothetical protein n=1 Tax=Streptomyces sp. NPDC046261 TaxID=3157200 RepID=UPI0033FDFE4E
MRTKNRLMTALAAILWVITLHAVGFCLVVVLMIATWSAAAEHPTEAVELLLQVAGILTAATAALTATWYALKHAGLSPAARSAITGALACPGPLGLALYVYVGN